MKRNFLFCLLFVVAICLVVVGSCMDHALESGSSSGENPSSDQLAEMKHYFETTAPALRQVSFDAPHATRNAFSSEQIDNLLPNWDKSRMLETHKRIYYEIPLKGDGLYRHSLFRSGGEAYSYPTRSFLVLVKDKQTGTIGYHVATTILTRVGRKQSPEAEFHYVGNRDLEGLLLFSRVDGTLLQAIHLRNGKPRPIGLAPLPDSLRADGFRSGDNELSTLRLFSTTSSYRFNEQCVPTCEGCCSECKAYCIICKKPYCIDNPECSNGCEIEIPGDKRETCSYCGLTYPSGSSCPKGCGTFETICSVCGTSYASSPCPNGCSAWNCFICGKYPCQCRPACESCGSIYCPGPWSCSPPEDRCVGEKCSDCGGYKNNTRNGSDCPACTCDIYEVTLKTVPDIVDLGDSYVINVTNSSRTQATVSQVNYYISYLSDNEPLSLGTSTTLSKEVRTYAPGAWNLKATVLFSNGKTATTPVLKIIIRNPLYSKIMANPTVVAKMNALWEATVKTALDSVYREKGCCIFLNTADNSYKCDDVSDSKDFDCSGTVELVFPTDHIKKTHPDRGGIYFVGTFHTHPARTICNPMAKYGVGPSDADKKMNTVCLLYDYRGKGGYIPGGHTPLDSFKLYHCGLERHPIDTLKPTNSRINNVLRIKESFEMKSN